MKKDVIVYVYYVLFVINIIKINFELSTMYFHIS